MESNKIKCNDLNNIINLYYCYMNANEDILLSNKSAHILFDDIYKKEKCLYDIPEKINDILTCIDENDNASLIKQYLFDLLDFISKRS